MPWVRYLVGGFLFSRSEGLYLPYTLSLQSIGPSQGELAEPRTWAPYAMGWRRCASPSHSLVRQCISISWFCHQATETSGHQANKRPRTNPRARDDYADVCWPNRNIRKYELAVAFDLNFVDITFRVLVRVMSSFPRTNIHHKRTWHYRGFRRTERTCEHCDACLLLGRIVVKKNPV